LGQALRIHHVAMRTADVDRLERFYGSVLGLRVVKRDAERGSVWLQAGGAVIMLEPLSEGEDPMRAGSMELLAFSALDRSELGVWRERLAKAGVAVEAATVHTLYFRDPDGRRIAVSDYGFPSVPA
jgi:catechol-2,3-dioxygenase